MKSKDLLILAGVGIGAYLLFGGKTTTTKENGGETLLSSLPIDLSWLSDVIPQNMLPSIGITTGEAGLGNITDMFQDLLGDILGKGGKGDEGGGEAATKDPTLPPQELEDLGGVIPTSPGKVPITGETPWEDIAKRFLGAMSPQTANILQLVGAGVGGASIIGGGIYATRALYPGARTAFQGFGSRIATFWTRLGIKGGGGIGSGGVSMALTPGMTGGFGTSNLALDLLTQGNLLDAFKVFIGGPGAFGVTSGGQYPFEGTSYGVTIKTSGYRVMQAGEAPSFGERYDTKNYPPGSGKSSVKPLGTSPGVTIEGTGRIVAPAEAQGFTAPPSSGGVGAGWNWASAQMAGK